MKIECFFNQEKQANFLRGKVGIFWRRAMTKQQIKQKEDTWKIKIYKNQVNIKVLLLLSPTIFSRLINQPTNHQ